MQCHKISNEFNLPDQDGTTREAGGSGGADFAAVRRGGATDGKHHMKVLCKGHDSWDFPELLLVLESLRLPLVKSSRKKQSKCSLKVVLAWCRLGLLRKRMADSASAATLFEPGTWTAKP